MSHITRIVTRLGTGEMERRAIARALEDLGFKDEPSADGGFQIGEIRFIRNGDNYVMMADSDYIDHSSAMHMTHLVTQRYAYHITREKLEAQGFTLVEEERCSDGRLHLVLRRTV